MSRETCYVLEDGSLAHPRDVSRDAKGVQRHKDGRAVQMRGDVPRTRQADLDAFKAEPIKEPVKEPDAPVADLETKAETVELVEAIETVKPADTKEMKPEQTRRPYRTRESKAE